MGVCIAFRQRITSWLYLVTSMTFLIIGGQYWPMGLPSSRYHLKNACSKIKERLNFHIRMKYLSMYARHDINSDPDIPGPVTFLSAPVHRKIFLGSNLKESDGNFSADKYVQRPNYAPWMYVEDILNDATDILYKISWYRKIWCSCNEILTVFRF